ncbi:MAG: efflux RND transporter periplasmic adaptor subunit [Candidatus Hydrogenedens sp.]|nr:efflux RND transporter periplasmic adaptor subunit [Candidatus Hydrogenedens sp.]
MKYRVFTFPALALLSALTPRAEAQPHAAPPPPEVEVLTTAPRNLPVSFEYIGVTEASKTVEVRSRIRGFIEARIFDEGAVVTAGEQLFTIDPRSFQADLDIAKAQVEQAESRLKLAEQEVRRLQSVKEPGAIAQSDLDQRVAEQTNAAAALRLARAQFAKAELELSYTTVESPLDGYIGKALKEIGSFVDESQNSLLAMVWQVDPIYISFQVSEREYLALRTQTEAGDLLLDNAEPPYVEVTLLNGDTLPQRGEIDFESAVVDIRTGTVEMRAVLENQGEHALKPGQFVTATLRGWVRPNVIAVPQRAVGQSPQGAYVYVVDAENKAEYRVVQPGPWSGDDWIIDSGLQPGERVIVEGLVKVQPGIVVVPQEYTPGAEPAEEAAAETAAAPAE